MAVRMRYLSAAAMSRRETFQALAAFLAAFLLLSLIVQPRPAEVAGAEALSPMPRSALLANHTRENSTSTSGPITAPTQPPELEVPEPEPEPEVRLSAPAPAPVAVSAANKAPPLADAHCRKMYGVRRFVDPPMEENPPYLWTFPGSGNTWARLLIEFATGYYSGSVYDDRKLRHVLRGEMTCNRANVMIKAHPHTHPFEVLDNTPFSKKCGNITAIDKAVLLVRDPYDACWSEYQRRVTTSHTGKITRAKFRRPQWEAVAGGLAYDFQIMWDLSYIPFMVKHPEGYLLIRYEDLRNPNKQLDALASILHFIGRPQSIERMRCAFMLANHPSVHRQQPLTQHHLQSTAHQPMPKDEAYTPELICKMWETFSTSALAMGYSIRNSTDCSAFATAATEAENLETR